MTRLIGLAVLVLAACNTGSVPPAGGFQDAPGKPIDAPGSNNEPADASCATSPVASGDGHHKHGQSCITAACHLPGQAASGAPEFIIAGTIYKDVAGQTQAPLATLVIPDGTTTHNLVSANSPADGVGNFYVEAGVETQITAGGIAESLCPTAMMMTQALANSATTTDGNCNRSGCHNSAANGIGVIHQ